MAPMLVRFSRTRYPPGTRQPTHAHDDIQVSLMLRGGLIEECGELRAHAGPMSMVVKRAGVEHADTYGPGGAQLLRIALDPADVERLLGDCDRARLPAWRWLHDRAATRALLRLYQHALTGQTDLQDDPALSDLLAALATWRGAPRHGCVPGWLQRVREQLEEEGNTRIRVSGLALDAGVHPVHLTRAFRQWFGCTVSGYLQRLRLRRACELLARPERPLARVALDAGFADQPHFCRQFFHATGLTPGAWRRLLD
jgi:AraC family transcriptional regulator